MSGANIPGTRLRLPVFGASRAGAVPAAGQEPSTTKFLREDGQFAPPSGASPTTTEGDLIVRGSSADQRLGIGTNGQVATVDTAVSGKVKWSTPLAGVLLYVNTSVPAGNTVADTTTETAFASSATVGANTPAVGQVYYVDLAGVYSTAAVAPTLRGKVKWGSTVIADTGTISALVGLAANRGWNARVVVVVHAVGASGTIEVQSRIEFSTSATVALTITSPNTAGITVDTTADKAITVTVEWGTADAANTITLREMVVSTASATTVASTNMGGDLTGTFPNPTIDVGKVTLAKLADLATQRVVGRNTAGMGVPEAVTLSQLLDWIGSAARGDLLARGAATWARLAMTSGKVVGSDGTDAVYVNRTPSWWFGDGNDGAATFDGSTAVAGFSRSGSTYTATRDTNFTSATVSGGVRVKMDGMVLCCSGTLTNDGTIDVNGGDAVNNTAGAIQGPGNLDWGTATGATGRTTVGSGTGTSTKSECIGAAGGNGGGNGVQSGGTAGGATAISEATRASVHGPNYVAETTLTNTSGGTTRPNNGTGGGAGGHGGVSGVSGGGGAPGGILRIRARAIAGSGAFEAKGGAGGNATGTNNGGGGGGGGGAIDIVCDTSTFSGTRSVAKGAGGTGTGTGVSGSDGSDGTFNRLLTAA